MKSFTAKLVAGLLISAIGLIPSLGAQTTQAGWNALKAVTAGTQVRITDGSRTVDGKLDQTTDDVIMVTSGKGHEMFDRRDVSIVSVKKQSHRKRNTLIGLGVGAGGGLAFGGVLASAVKDSMLGGHGPAIVASSAGAGALVGVLVGAVIPSGGWRQVYKKIAPSVEGSARTRK
jgi:hypothetical protein